MEKLRILYVASEIAPFLQTTQIANFVKKISQNMQDRGFEIRIIVPRFGIINERKNRLHEVVRLSGINISVGDDEKPLIIKVASIPNAKLQVYFIDNEDFFLRKSTFVNEANSEFHNDNDERAIFFCKGTLETVKKLGWAPHIIHCHDWFTSLIPLYLKTAYRKDPVFRNSKTVFSIFNSEFNHTFGEDLADKVRIMDVTDEMLTPLQTPNYEGLLRLALENADAITVGETELNQTNEKIIADYQNKKDILSADATEDDFFELYNSLSNELVTIS
jgi:starch synthase